MSAGEVTQQMVFFQQAGENKGELTMQERYCECGKRLFVEYLFSAISWLPVFWNTPDAASGNIHACPCCGKSIDINALK